MSDRISNLPDEVLGHILSFLPTENAVATMVLSKRWKLLWHLVSTLDFEDGRYFKGKEWESDTPFINFVSAAILSPGLHQPIKNFKLEFQPTEEFPYSDVEAWLNAAIQRQVENLKLQFNIFKMPCSCCILSCSTLVVLDLWGVKFDAFSSVHLPALKTLHLDDVMFSNIQLFMELLNGCPILENLEAADLSFYDDSFEGKVKTLPKLVRADFISHDFIPMKVFSNVEFLRIDKCDVDIPMFPNLIYLELFVGGYEVKWSVALDMLNHCPKLQTVVFVLSHDDEVDVWPDPGFVPECFSSHLRKCFLRRFSAVECHKRFARYVMQNATLLRSMIICGSYSQNDPRKLEMITELASYPRSSAVCDLVFK